MSVDVAHIDRYCLSCRHSLRGLPGHRCPECGREFDPQDHATTAPSASRFNAEWRVALTRVLTVAWGILAAYCFIVTLLGLDPFVWMWVWVILGGIIVVPLLIATIVLNALPGGRLSRRSRIVGIALPLLVLSIVWTCWPFRITFWLHKSRMEAIANQVLTGTPPALPLQVGLFKVYRADPRWAGQLGLHVRGPTIGGTHLVRAGPNAADRIGMNLNWKVNLGGGWYYVYED